MSVQPIGDYDGVSKAEAAKRLRNGNVSIEEKAAYAAKFGADFVNQALSVDSTKYEIDDADYNAAKNAGAAAAKDSTGYDGGKTGRAVVDAVESVGATVVANTVGKKVVDKFAVKIFGEGGAISNGTSKHASDIATAILTSAVAAKYYIDKPNEDQLEAARHLMENEFPDSQAALSETQEIMTEASEEITELTEEAESVNEEANQKIQEDKTLFDFYKQQYEALKIKKENGGKLTPDEQALMKQLAPLMEGLNKDITTTSEDTSGQVNDLNDTIGEYQDVFDESAETMAEVEGVTDFAENFDENTRTMMYVEAAAQGINGVSAGVAAARLWAKNVFGILTPFAVMSSAAAIASAGATKQQLSWASEMSNEIDIRSQVQELNSQTTDMYDEELDNYAGNLETIEDLELEVPEDIVVPTDTAATGAETNGSIMSAAAQKDKEQTGTPVQNDGNKNNDDDKKKPEEK